MIVNSNKVRAVEWARRIDDWRKSGLSLPRFCEQNAIKLTAMNRWLYDRRCKQAVEEVRRVSSKTLEAAKVDASPPNPKSPVFLPVRVRETVTKDVKRAEVAHHEPIEIVMGKNRRVVVPRGFDIETLRQVIAILEPLS